MKELLKELEPPRRDVVIATIVMTTTFLIVLAIARWHPQGRGAPCGRDGVVMRMDCRMEFGLLETCDEVCAEESVGW